MKKRLRIRFRLATLLTILILAGIPVGWYVARAERQRKVVDWLRENHGDATLQILYSYQQNAPKAWDEQLGPPAPQWLVSLLGEDYFGTVTFVLVKGIDDLSKLTALKNLETLMIVDYRNDLEAVPEFKKLKDFAMMGGTTWDLTPLHKCKSLESLYLARSPVTEYERDKLRDALPHVEIQLMEKTGLRVIQSRFEADPRPSGFLSDKGKK